jgi:hypothetical protein
VTSIGVAIVSSALPHFILFILSFRRCLRSKLRFRELVLSHIHITMSVNLPASARRAVLLPLPLPSPPPSLPVPSCFQLPASGSLLPASCLLPPACPVFLVVSRPGSCIPLYPTRTTRTIANPPSPPGARAPACCTKSPSSSWPKTPIS